MRVVGVHEVGTAAADRLRAAGCEVRAFASGAELEAFVRTGTASGVLDLVLGDVLADPDRLTAASLLGVPQVAAPAALDGLSPQAADRLGLDVAQKLSASGGPAAVVLPLRGLTAAGDVFNQAVRNWAYGFEVVEADADADGLTGVAADVLLRLMGRSRAGF